MPPRKRLTKIFQCDLPSDHRERILELREIAGRLPFHERYLAGEFRQVWQELCALGDEVQYDPVAIDALAVAYETMHRAATNVDTIIRRLKAVGYEFRQTIFSPYWKTSVADAATMDFFERQIEEMREMADALGPVDVPPELRSLREQLIAQEKSRAHAARERRMGIVPPHVPPEPVSDLRFNRVVRSAGGIPFSLRAWYQSVGGVNLVGSHPELTPPGVQCDPLFVAPFQFVLDLCQAWAEDHAGREERPSFRMPISPHRIAKAGGNTKVPLYVVTLPNGGFDAILKNEPHGLHFIEYLRLSFKWGGFPGWADGTKRVPKLITSLSEGLLPL